MASPNFKAYDRSLRRIYMLNLVEALSNERNGGFRASLVINAHTGLPAVGQDEFEGSTAWAPVKSEIRASAA